MTSDTESKASILFVDDERHIVRQCVEALEKAGYKVAGAYDGVEAIEWLKAHRPPDLVLLDLIMPPGRWPPGIRMAQGRCTLCRHARRFLRATGVLRE